MHILLLVSLQELLFLSDLPEKLIVLAVPLSSTLLGYMKERKEIQTNGEMQFTLSPPTLNLAFIT